MKKPIKRVGQSAKKQPSKKNIIKALLKVSDKIQCDKANHKLRPLTDKEINGTYMTSGKRDKSTIIGKKGDQVCVKCSKVFYKKGNLYVERVKKVKTWSKLETTIKNYPISIEEIMKGNALKALNKVWGNDKDGKYQALYDKITGEQAIKLIQEFQKAMKEVEYTGQLIQTAKTLKRHKLANIKAWEATEALINFKLFLSTNLFSRVLPIHHSRDNATEAR